VSSRSTFWRWSKAVHEFAAVFAATVEANNAIGTNTNRRKNAAVFIMALLSPFAFALRGLGIERSWLVARVIVGTTGSVTDFRANIVGTTPGRTVAHA